jgi:hypothetical protein
VTNLRQALSKSRPKCGLINVGGWILNTLFGSATEQQIQDLQELAQETRTSGQAVTHKVNDMVTVVNTMSAEMNTHVT